MITEGKNYLATLHEYIVAPDGEQYKAIWGQVKVESSGTSSLYTFGMGEGSAIVNRLDVKTMIECKARPSKKPGKYSETAYPNKEHINNLIYFTDAD